MTRVSDTQPQKYRDHFIEKKTENTQERTQTQTDKSEQAQ